MYNVYKIVVLLYTCLLEKLSKIHSQHKKDDSHQKKALPIHFKNMKSLKTYLYQKLNPIVMMNKFYTLLIVLFTITSSCDSNAPDPEIMAKIDPKPNGSTVLAKGCDVNLMSLNKITADQVTANLELGDYIFTIKNINTVKKRIGVKVDYFQGRDVVASSASAQANVAVNETITIRVTSSDINSLEDFGCIVYFIQVEADGIANCEFDGNDC